MQTTVLKDTYKIESGATPADNEIEHLGQTTGREDFPRGLGGLITITSIAVERTRYAHTPPHQIQLDGGLSDKMDHTSSKR